MTNRLLSTAHWQSNGYVVTDLAGTRKKASVNGTVYVLIGGSREGQDRSFADMVRISKADLQSGVSSFLTQLAPVQRY